MRFRGRFALICILSSFLLDGMNEFRLNQVKYRNGYDDHWTAIYYKMTMLIKIIPGSKSEL